MFKEYKISGNRWLTFGFNQKRIALSIQIDRHGISIDLLFFWVGFEW
jgi:hypothetical protein